MGTRITRAGIYIFIHEDRQVVYVGQSKSSTTSRITQHFDLLDRGKHHSKRLQELYDETQGDGWDFRIVERPPHDLPLDELAEWLAWRELHWHEYYTVRGYRNLSSTASIPNAHLRHPVIAVSLPEVYHRMLEQQAARLEWSKGRLLSNFLEYSLSEQAIANYIERWLRERLDRVNSEHNIRQGDSHEQ